MTSGTTRDDARALDAQDTLARFRDAFALPDGVIYKPCGNRRASVCPSCSQLYKRDAYQIVRAGLVGGIAWTLFAQHELVGFEAEISHLIVFMALVYLAGCVVGLLRYR